MKCETSEHQPRLHVQQAVGDGSVTSLLHGGKWHSWRAQKLRETMTFLGVLTGDWYRQQLEESMKEAGRQLNSNQKQRIPQGSTYDYSGD